MIQTESVRLGCVCPDCGYHCADCLGTDSVVSRTGLEALREDPRFLPENLLASLQAASGGEEDELPDDMEPDYREDGGF